MDEDQDISRGYDANRRWWDAVTGPHVRSNFYDVESFLAGRNTLPHYVVDEVGDVSGKSLLHLQCHFGQDTLSWARLGASVTGIDFGGEAIAQAKNLAGQIGVDARFIQTNIYDLPQVLDEQFEVVFTSHGVLGWLHDLAAWGRIAAAAVRPGGFFYISDFHPIMDTLQYERPIARSDDLFPGNPYFDPGEALVISGEESADYADSDLSLDLETHEWFHSLEDIFSAVLDAGLQIELFREHDFCVYQARKGMVKGEDGFWRLPEGVTRIPLMFSLRARKPA